jgi:hypothetical protein
VADFAMPAVPGDSSAAIRFFAPGGGVSNLAEIPFSLRTLIPLGSTGGNFTGTLTGGNGRPGAGPTQTFAFDVPSGVRNMSLTLQIADSGYLLQGLLVDPNGMQLSVEPNLDSNGNPQNGLQLFRENPQPGRWHFVLLQNFSTSGNQTSLEFIARIGFNGAKVTATGLPDSAGIRLAAGKPVDVAIQVVNTGSVTSLFFADARLNKRVTQPLALQITPSCPTPPLTLPSTCGLFVVPTQANSVQFTAKSSVQITMDVSNQVGFGVGITGNPDLYATQISPGHIVASLSEPEIPFGSWLAFPSLVGPYGPAGAFTAPVTLTASATIRAFDAAVASDSGDLWADITLGTVSFSPLVLGSGETGVINVTITPDATNIGRTVSGFIYIDTFNPNVGTGDEVVRLPYAYTVTR